MAVPAYLLDTGILLLATRAGNASKVIDAQFGLSASSFRPAICEVSVGELLAFATASRWGEKRKAELMERLKASLILPISHPGVHQRWADMQSTLQGAGIAVGQNDLWIAATASVRADGAVDGQGLQALGGAGPRASRGRRSEDRRGGAIG